MAAESMSNKMIPALIYKNEENEYDIDVYELCNIRDVQVWVYPLKSLNFTTIFNYYRRDLYPKQTDPLKKLINEEMKSDEVSSRYISSINIQPKSIVKESSEVKLISQPTKKIIYKNSVEISVRN